MNIYYLLIQKKAKLKIMKFKKIVNDYKSKWLKYTINLYIYKDLKIGNIIEKNQFYE